MSEQWSDEDLIGYCEIHCKTELALFHGKHINEMFKLAGIDRKVEFENGFYAAHESMSELCKLARKRLKDGPEVEEARGREEITDA